MDWLEIDIYNILLDFMSEDKADECVSCIMNRIRHPECMTHVIDCVGD